VERRHVTTEHLHVNTNKCTACGECVDECIQQVLEMVGIKFLIIDHRHINVARPEDCIGCLSCIEACSENAIMENVYG